LSFEEYYDRAVERNEAEDYQGTIEDYIRVIKLSPKAAPNYFNRGMTRANLGDIEGAKEGINYSQEIA